MIPGTIRNIMSYGVFVQFAGQLVGLSPNKVSILRFFNQFSDWLLITPMQQIILTDFNNYIQEI